MRFLGMELFEMKNGENSYADYLIVAVVTLSMRYLMERWFPPGGVGGGILEGSNNGGRRRRVDNERELKRQEKLEDRKPGRLWNTAMFFPDYHADEGDSTAQQFLWYFQQARTSIRICIYNFSFPELEYVIVEQYKRGLLVQFVVGQQNTAEALRRKCIPCGVFPKDPGLPETDQLMHHKFAVFDDEAVLVGSMNWTTEGILNNNENICVSTNPAQVDKYLQEFYRLLTLCEKARTFY